MNRHSPAKLKVRQAQRRALFKQFWFTLLSPYLFCDPSYFEIQQHVYLMHIAPSPPKLLAVCRKVSHFVVPEGQVTVATAPPLVLQVAPP